VKGHGDPAIPTGVLTEERTAGALGKINSQKKKIQARNRCGTIGRGMIYNLRDGS